MLTSIHNDTTMHPASKHEKYYKNIAEHWYLFYIIHVKECQKDTNQFGSDEYQNSNDWVYDLL